MIGDRNELGLVKADSASWRLRRRRWRVQDLHELLQDLHNRGFMNVQARAELFLQRSEFLRKLTGTKQRFAHLDEGADDEEAHLNGALTAKDIRSL